MEQATTVQGLTKPIRCCSTYLNRSLNFQDYYRGINVNWIDATPSTKSKLAVEAETVVSPSSVKEEDLDEK